MYHWRVSKSSRARRTHRRDLVDPETLDRRGGPYQLRKAALAAGFEVVVSETPTLGVVTVGGVHESRGAFHVHWRDGAVSSAEYTGQPIGISSVTKVKAWLRDVDSGTPERPRS